MKSEKTNLYKNSFVDGVHHGDCISVLSQLASGRFDFVLTDPPYLASYIARDGRTVPNDDSSDWIKPAFQQIFRVMRWNRFCVSFYGWHKADTFLSVWREAGFRIVGHLTFVKRYASTERFLRYQHENAYLLAKGNPQKPTRTIPDVLEWKYTGNKLHPTQKPVSVLTPLVECFSNPGDVVLDPFCGSGSTLLAAKQVNRRYFGIELSQNYFDLAEQRLC
jgi:site-specific DNA-methyltransferase (adenine-specific)